MRTFSGNLFVLALVYLGFVLFLDARHALDAEVVDQSRVVMLFGAVVLIGLIAGTIVVLTYLPSVGEIVGNFFFNPDKPIEKGPHAGALAAIAKGDYPQAVEEYRRCLHKDPNDTHAISEIVHLYCDKIHDPEAAAGALEEALSRDWVHEDAAFLSQRLAEVYWTHQHNARRARELLLQVIENFPNSKHSANASHRLQEIERQLARED